MRLSKIVSLVTLLGFIAVGCKSPKPDYDRPLPPGHSALRKITDPAQLPDFTGACSQLENLRNSVQNSINYLNKPSSHAYYPITDISHARVLQGLQAFAALLDSAPAAAQLNAEILRRFDVYISIGCDDAGTVLFTGYYTPIFNGAETRTDEFQYPLYASPDGLVKGANGDILGLRDASGNVDPLPDRAGLKNSAILTGKEIVWLSDPFEVYIAHVQGSVKLMLSDGKLQTYGYAATNGHEYHRIADELIADGRIAADELSLATMINYFKQNPQEIENYVNRNPRFVFFQKSETEPRGSLNEPVTPMRSIATDKKIFPRGALTLVQTRLPAVIGRSFENRPYSGFTLDQDTGGAIRAPGRCDIYMGQGAVAGRLAGQTYQEGKLYYLVLKEDRLPPLIE